MGETFDIMLKAYESARLGQDSWFELLNTMIRDERIDTAIRIEYNEKAIDVMNHLLEKLGND